MDDNFERWAEVEVARLRKEAERFIAEANGLDQALSRWRSMHGRSSHPKANGHAPARRSRVRGRKAWLIEQVQAAGIQGIDRREMVEMILAKFPAYNMNSVRSLIWELTKEIQQVRREGDRFFANQIAAGPEEPAGNPMGA